MFYCHSLSCRWAKKRTRPSLDKSQDIRKTFVDQNDNVTTMRFTRKRNTGDNRDLELNCQYFLYAWGGDINKNTMILKHKQTAVSNKEICVCSVAPLTPTFTVIPNPTAMPNPSEDTECPPQCSLGLDRCQNSPVCMPLLQQYHRACRDVIEYKNTGNMPVCTNECKEAAEELKTDRLGMLYSCCSCDNDMCNRSRRNFERFCNVAPLERRECKEMQRACDMNTPSKCTISL